MDKTSVLIDIVSKHEVKVRVKATWDEEPSNWDSPLTSPSPGYIETPELGPVSLSEAEWIEINPVKKVERGSLLPPEKVDLRKDLSLSLTTTKLDWKLVGGIIRVKLSSD